MVRMNSLSSNLDAMDRRILALLESEGRLPIVELAARVGLSPTPCQRRVKRLEADGVIRGYAARLDPKAMGRGLQAFVLVNLTSHGEETVAAFQQAVRARPEVAAAYTLSGEFDYLLQVAVPDLEAFSEFALKALLHLPGVRDTRSSFALSIVK